MDLIPREIETYLLQQIQKQKITVLIGSRQTGKTTLLKLIQKKYLPDNSVYISCDNPDIFEFFSSAESIKNLLSLNDIKLEKSVYVFLDEFQIIPELIHKIKYLSDADPNLKFILSGSSSLKIISHLQESLAGRKRVVALLPFCYREIFPGEMKRFSGKPFTGSLSIEKTEIFELQKEFMIFGKMPKIFLERNHREKISELKEIYTSYIEKDIRHFIKGEEFVKINMLLKLLANQCGKEVNIQSLSKLSMLSAYKIKEYLRIFEQTFVIHLLPPYRSNQKQEIVKQPKVYFLDNGIRNVILNSFASVESRSDKGELFENLVFSELFRLTTLYPDVDLYYWKNKNTKTEIAFIIKCGERIFPIEVKYQLSRSEKMIALDNFAKRMNSIHAYVISSNRMDLNDQNRYVTLWNDLLEKDVSSLN